MYTPCGNHKVSYCLYLGSFVKFFKPTSINTFLFKEIKLSTFSRLFIIPSAISERFAVLLTDDFPSIFILPLVAIPCML